MSKNLVNNEIQKPNNEKSAFDNFAELTKKLINVDKKELDELSAKIKLKDIDCGEEKNKENDESKA